jgi:hypothetical protein
MELRDALTQRYSKILAEHLIEQARATVANPSIVPPWEEPLDDITDEL